MGASYRSSLKFSEYTNFFFFFFFFNHTHIPSGSRWYKFQKYDGLAAGLWVPRRCVLWSTRSEYTLSWLGLYMSFHVDRQFLMQLAGKQTATGKRRVMGLGTAPKGNKRNLSPAHHSSPLAGVWDDILTPLYIDPGVNILYDILTPGSIYRNDILTPLTIFWPPLPIVHKTVLLVM